MAQSGQITHTTNEQTGGAKSALTDRIFLFVKTWIGTASFSRDAIASFSLNIFSAAVSLLSTLILARLVGAENYGIYAASIVYANVFAVIACFGFPQLIIRTQARSTHADSQDAPRAVMKMATYVAFLVGKVLAVMGYMFSELILPASTAHVGWAFAIAMVMVVPLAGLRLRESILLGRHQPILSLLPERVFRPVIMLVVVAGLALFAGSGLSATHAIGAQALAYVVSIAGAFYLVARTAPAPQPQERTNAIFEPDLIREALPFLFVGLTTLLAGRVDIMMLAALADAETVGQYRLASQIAALAMMITTVSQVVLSPKISKLSHEKKLGTLLTRLPQLSGVLFLFAALLSTFLYLAFQFGLPWIGTDFSKSGPVLIILLIAFSVVAILSPALPLLTMSGHAKYAAYANVIAITINIVLNLILIPTLGGQGAALSTGLSLVSLYVLYACLAARLAK